MEAQTATGWQLIWSDEFNGTAGSPPDPAKWNFDIGRGNPPGWGNNELETYTNSPQNAFQDGNGNLVIRAIRDANGNYTSARLQTGAPGASTHTSDGNWQYGRVIARIKLPYLKGTWPAFWTLGENIGTVGWPACGELDIMENFGGNKNNAGVNNGTAHGPGYSGGQGITKSYTLPYGEKVADDFHIYAIEWSQDSVQWSVDGVVFHTVTPASLPAGAKWVFNAPFFILLNLAVGGNAAGNPNANAPFPPQDMLVDYVRVYQPVPVAATAPVILPGTVFNAASFLSTLAPGSLATLYGSNLSDAEHLIAPNPGFPPSVADVSVSVNGLEAPLTYVSPGQINFQVPWETAAGPADIEVTRNGTGSNAETVTVTASAPSPFLSDLTSGMAWVNGPGCETVECAVHPGGSYWLWGNGFGPKTKPSQDGVGASGPIDVPGGPASCQLTIGGQPAAVQYCGAAPAEIIDQLNFVYPTGVAGGSPFVDATLTIGDTTGHFHVPAPNTGQG
jgi:uncharacterized protein (TIGR03437 family)